MLACASVLVWFSPWADALTWRRAEFASHPWTLWTAPLVHLSGAHLVGNLGALAALTVLGVVIPLGPRATLAWLLTWPLSTATLWLWPQVTSYVGLSGLVHAGVAIVWLHARQTQATRGWAALLLFMLLLKLGSEQAWVQPVVFNPNWGMNIVVAAHLGGATVGGLLGWLFLVRIRFRIQPDNEAGS